jgi:hypothetical protein
MKKEIKKKGKRNSDIFTKAEGRSENNENGY